MPACRTPTTYAILGLLNVSTWTTYELAKQVQRSLNWFWPRAERKLYDEPKRLVADGLATATKESTGNRPRTVYGITDAGRAELRRWLDEPPAPPSTEFEGMLKVFFAEVGSREQLLANIDAIGKAASDRLEALVEFAEGGAAQHRFPARRHLGALTIRLRYDQERAVVAWAQWAREQVEQWVDAGDPGAWDARREYTRLAHAIRAGAAR